jgi:hypothetical protein
MMAPRVGAHLKKVPKRRKRPKMAKLPGGKTRKSGEENGVLNTSENGS